MGLKFINNREPTPTEMAVAIYPRISPTFISAHSYPPFFRKKNAIRGQANIDPCYQVSLGIERGGDFPLSYIVDNSAR